MVEIIYPPLSIPDMIAREKLWLGSNPITNTLLEIERRLYSQYDNVIHCRLDVLYPRTKEERKLDYNWRLPTSATFSHLTSPAILVSLRGNIVRIMCKEITQQDNAYCVVRMYSACTPSDNVVERFDPRYLEVLEERYLVCKEQSTNDLVIQKFQDEVIKYMNRYFAFIRSNQTIYEKIIVAGNVQLQLYNVQGFKDAYCDTNVSIITETKHKQSAAVFWLENRNRTTYVIADFTSDADQTVFNLFRGLKYSNTELDNVDAELAMPIVEHLYYIWCKRNENDFCYVINWFAHLCQHPCAKMKVALVLHSRQGAGKGIVLQKIGEIFGTHFKSLSIEEATGKFNRPLLDTLLLFLDETVFSGDKNTSAKLKVLITEDTRQINEKYIPSFSARNLTNVILATNNMWAAPVEKDDRRYFVLDLSNERANNRLEDLEYFDRLAGVPALSLYKLLVTLDITNFKPTRFPMNNATREQKEMTLGTVAMWWVHLLENGDDAELFGNKIPKVQLYDRYKEWITSNATGRRVEAVNWFWKELKEMVAYEEVQLGPASARVRCVAIPNLVQSKITFSQYVKDEKFFTTTI